MLKNPFNRRPKNPLDQLSLDELREARLRLERSRERTLNQIRELEAQKAVYFEEGVGGDSRVRLDRARRIKEVEEQIRHLDQQLIFFGKQIQIINRLRFIKENRAQLVDLGIDEVLGGMDSEDLRRYVEEISLSGAVNLERLDDLAKMLEEALGGHFADDADPELSHILAEMERAAMGEPMALPTSEPSTPEVKSGEEPPLST